MLPALSPLDSKMGYLKVTYIYLFFQVEKFSFFSVMHVMNIGCTIIS